MPKVKNKPAATFGSRLKQLREDRSMTITELARRIGVTPPAIWHWEKRGRMPKAATIQAVAKELNVSSEFLENGVHIVSTLEQGPSDQISMRPDEMSLEQLIRAIEAKGFYVQISSAGSREASGV
ncbi:helix-turn-helix domain-containing protein [Bradyrhizobium sp. CCBAU 53340]|uniref:helix-turn-helix domain-containing protein n=1 Tax=Bradyrhizobium sp. CCBAU 53340 TaxID=1325112 RepID=UPI00188BF7E7|nr:helix-turn-helix transcriptional regulator [Bradyrhizobium sp. CCBAU 53340]